MKIPPLTGGIYSVRRGRYELWLAGRLIAHLDGLLYASMGEQGRRRWRNYYWQKYLGGGQSVADRIPELTRQPVLYVDATPDSGLPLRILRAHRENCACKFVADPPSPLITMMNELNDQRAVILDRAIAILEEHMLRI